MPPKQPDERLWRARKLIDDCFQMPLTLDELSDAACFSRYHFLRSFRQAFHATPHQYLMRKRLEKARQLLISSQMSVTQICYEVGFQSLGSFSLLFRRHTGKAPLHYRDQMRTPPLNTSAFIPGCFLKMWNIQPAM